MSSRLCLYERSRRKVRFSFCNNQFNRFVLILVLILDILGKFHWYFIVIQLFSLYSFDNYGWAMLDCFRLMTQDYWENLYLLVKEKQLNFMYVHHAIFFLGTIISWSISFFIFCSRHLFWFILFGELNLSYCLHVLPKSTKESRS